MQDQEEHKLKLDSSVVLLPDDPAVLDSCINYILDGEDNGFVDKMFSTNGRLHRDEFCRRMLTECYSFLQPHRLRHLVF